ncbi:hypothetical protein [Algoriphagus aquimarinus]|uniref:hypothetical protein n=1 Tax=Algoriphagus aquimarinus TaxID=237018 RepID=UPI0030DCAC81|tara:strand:- start:89 stop:289 length:201 start_codon:yes stop_codon:yes gene_type:complete
MNQDFNSAKDYFKRMRQEGKIKLTHDSAASQEMLVEMNEELEKMRQDFLMKEGRSMNEAKSIVINA